MAMIDTTNLPVIDVQENSSYKSTKYAIRCGNSSDVCNLNDSVTIEDVIQEGNKKQRVFNFNCGCKMIAVLIDKSVE